MWRRFWSCPAVKQGVSAAIHRNSHQDEFLLQSLGSHYCGNTFFSSLSSSPLPSSSDVVSKEAAAASSSSSSSRARAAAGGIGSADFSLAEAKKLMRLVNVEALKRKLGIQGKEVVGYSELLEACQTIGVARSKDEAIAFARVLDEAGVVLLFRDKVYLHPDKVVDLVRKAIPIALTAEDDPIRDEFKKLLTKKEEIDVLAHQQVRRILMGGLILSMLQVGLFFRLTFWEFSWDVMEPVAFFTTATGLVLGYAYFLITSRDPTYQDLLKRLFLNRQRKLFKKHNFDVERFKELQLKCKVPLDAATCVRSRVGVEVDLEDATFRKG